VREEEKEGAGEGDREMKKPLECVGMFVSRAASDAYTLCALFVFYSFFGKKNSMTIRIIEGLSFDFSF
jgi:hypothetical protein